MSKKQFVYIFFFCAAILFSSSSFSMPAYPDWVTLKQKNGDEITVKMKGDERIHWMESEDGYTLLYDSEKNIVFAQLNEQGDMVPSAIQAVNKKNRSTAITKKLTKIPKGIQYSEEQRQISSQLWEMKEDALRSSSLRAPVGTAKAICALIQFSDKPFTRTLEEFNQLMNQVGYNAGGARGSVRDYYLENSYGQLILEVTVVGPYTAAKAWSYYGQNSGSRNDINAGELAREAANLAFNNSSVNPADYDNDNDGYIDTFHFLYAGYGEEAGADPSSIWAHKSGFGNSLIFSGKRLNTYSCSPELRGNSGTNITHIGPICHELCHVFGAPDFYDADNAGSGGDYLGTGDWDLMAGGSWNGGNGASPAHINMYQKIKFGWVHPIELNSKRLVTDMPNSAENPVAYTIETPVHGEYYVLENRQRRGFDSYVPGSGLLIYHVSITQQNINGNTVNNGHPQRVYPVFAASTTALPNASPSSYGAFSPYGLNSDYCLFNSIRESFTDTSMPAMFTWNGSSISKPITEIKLSGGLVSFKFLYSSVLGIYLKFAVANDKVKLDWVKPPSTEQIAGYNIYRDNVFILNTTQLTCKDQVPANGTYKYGVSVKYASGAESAKEEVDVTVGSVPSGIYSVKNASGSVYPNPLAQGDELTVDLGADSENAALLFYDISGRLLMKKQATSAVSRQVINLPAGVYLLKIAKAKGTETIKFYVK